MESEHDVEACARKRMSRRYFFGLVGGAAAVAAMPAVLKPEPFVSEGPLLGLSMNQFSEVYLRPAMVSIANEIDANVTRKFVLTPEFIARTSLEILQNNLVCMKELNQKYEVRLPRRLYTKS